MRLGQRRRVRRGLQFAARLLFRLLLFLTLADAGLHLVLSTEWVQRRLRPRVEGALSYELQRQVRIGTIALSPFLNFLELRQAEVTGPGGAGDVQVDRVRLYPDLRRLLRQELVLRTVVLLRPVIDFPGGLPFREGRTWS